MEILQAEWQRKLTEVWERMLEDLSVPAFIAALGSGGEPPLMNSALKAILPVRDDLSADIEPAPPVYAPLRTVSFIRNGHKTREMTFDIFLVPAFTDSGHRTAVFGLKREPGDKPDALLVFVSCLLSFYGTDYMPKAVDVLNTLPAGAAVLDESGAYKYVSRLMAGWISVGTTKMQGMNVFEFSNGAVTTELMDCLLSGEISSIDWSSGKDNGETMFSQLRRLNSGLLAQTAAFTNDDTARESLAEAKELKKKLEETIDRSGVVAFILKPDKDWSFEYVSKNIERFGISRDSDMTARLGENIEDYVGFKKKARAALTGCYDYCDTFRLINDNGTAFSVFAEMRVVTAGGEVQIEGSFTDVSAREALKQQIADTRERVNGHMLETLNEHTADGSPCSITDILPVGFLQEHQDNFAGVFMLPSQMYDHTGKELTKSHGNCMGCACICGAVSNRLCKLWSAALPKLNVRVEEAVVVSCPDSAVTAAFFPIYVGKKLSAVWKLGSVILNGMPLNDDGTEQKPAKHIASNPAYQDLPRCEPESFKLAVDTLFILARNISAFATSCIRLSNDISRTDKMHGEVEALQIRSNHIGDCVDRVSACGNGDLESLMESVGKTFGCDRVYVYTARALSDEWLGKGIRPSAVRELTQEQWSNVSDKHLILDSRTLKAAGGQAQTVWRPIWRGDELFAIAAAGYCLECRDFSEPELELLDFMLSSVGTLIIMRGLYNTEKEALAGLEKELGSVEVLDYNTNAVIYAPEGSYTKDIPRDALIDEDGRINAPVTWESGGLRRKAAALYWYDGRLAVLVKIDN